MKVSLPRIRYAELVGPLGCKGRRMSRKTEPDWGSGSRMADVDARYEFKPVRTMRGREARTLAKWQKDGWELVTQSKGTLRTEMTFRRVKPMTIGTYFRKFASQSYAAFCRLDPKTQRRLLPVSGGLVLLIVGVGVVVGIQGGGGTFEPTASATKATTSPSEQPSEELSQEPGAVPVGPVRPTTTPAVSAPTPPVAGTALATVARLTVKGRAPKTGYTRAQFGQTWYDVDGNGCDTRNDILRRDLSSRQMKNACKVMAGTLATDPYTGTSIRFIYGGASELDIDHVVALSDAWQKGAAQWAAGKRLALANDPVNLLAVDASANRSKGDGDAATWLPSYKAYRCTYVARQVAVKGKYGVWVTAAERDAMIRVLRACPSMRLPGPGAASTLAAVPRAAEPVPQPKPAPAPAPAPVPPAGAVYYANCDAVHAAGAAPIHRGDPGYASKLDRDGDGIGCE